MHAAFSAQICIINSPKYLPTPLGVYFASSDPLVSKQSREREGRDEKEGAEIGMTSENWL